MAENSRINTFEQFISNNADVPSLENINPEIKKIGWLCTYTPEEIITAAGFMPSRIIGTHKTSKAEGYFPINYCPFVKSSMEDILDIASNNECFSGFVFTNSCDCMRRFYDICKKYVPGIPSFLLDVPRNKNNLSIMQFKNNIESMSYFLAGIGGKSMQLNELDDSIKLHNKKRALLNELDRMFKFSGKLTSANYFTIIKRAMTEEPLSFTLQLKKYIEYLKNNSEFLNNNPYIADVLENGPPVMIIGNFIEENKLWEIFDELNCYIASTDTCSSERYFKNITEFEDSGRSLHDLANLNADDGNTDLGIGKIIADIATRHLFKPQCMRMADLGKKIEEINRDIEKYNISGVIFISQKFCDNTLLFYPLLRQNLNTLKIPSLFLEIEHNNLSAGQIKTRIQAFIEIL